MASEQEESAPEGNESNSDNSSSGVNSPRAFWALMTVAIVAAIVIGALLK